MALPIRLNIQIETKNLSFQLFNRQNSLSLSIPHTSSLYSLSPSFYLSFFLPLSLSFFLSLSLSLSLFLSFSLSLSLSFFLSFSLFLSLSHTYILSLSSFRSYDLTLSFLLFPVYLTDPPQQTQKLTPKLTNTHLCLSLSLSKTTHIYRTIQQCLSPSLHIHTQTMYLFSNARTQSTQKYQTEMVYLF